MNIPRIDSELIYFFRKIAVPAARIGLFTIYFWFGILKVLGLSPATPLVEDLFNHTMPIMAFSTFIILFGIFEAVIGILFLIKGAERIVLPLLLIHMVMTFMPLILLPSVTWTGFAVPSLEGQYIIKNLVIIASAIGIMSQLHPLPRKNSY